MISCLCKLICTMFYSIVCLLAKTRVCNISKKSRLFVSFTFTLTKHVLSLYYLVASVSKKYFKISLNLFSKIWERTFVFHRHNHNLKTFQLRLSLIKFIFFLQAYKLRPCVRQNSHESEEEASLCRFHF